MSCLSLSSSLELSSRDEPGMWCGIDSAASPGLAAWGHWVGLGRPGDKFQLLHIFPREMVFFRH